MGTPPFLGTPFLRPAPRFQLLGGEHGGGPAGPGLSSWSCWGEPQSPFKRRGRPPPSPDCTQHPPHLGVAQGWDVCPPPIFSGPQMSPARGGHFLPIPRPPPPAPGARQSWGAHVAGGPSPPLWSSALGWEMCAPPPPPSPTVKPPLWPPPLLPRGAGTPPILLNPFPRVGGSWGGGRGL